MNMIGINAAIIDVLPIIRVSKLLGVFFAKNNQEAKDRDMSNEVGMKKATLASGE